MSREGAPSHVDLRQAVLFHRDGRLEEAERIYRAVLKIDPDHFVALYYLGLACAQQKQPDFAIPLFRAALNQNSEVPEVHNNLGMALYALRGYKDAVVCYEKAISLNPRYAIAYNNLGTALGALERHDDAIKRFEQALAIKGDYVEVLNNIGTEHFILGRYAHAINYFSKAVAARPDFAGAQLNLANAFLAANRTRDALESYKSALALKPLAADIQLRIGDFLQALNRPQEAVVYYKQALRSEPQSVDVQLKLGQLLQTMSRHEQAMACYQRVLELSPEHAEAYDCLGFALSELGNYNGARQAFESALRIEPGRLKSFFGLVNSNRITHSDPALAAMKQLTSNAHSLTVPEQVLLHFALGKALADVGEHGQSFAHLLEGNALRRTEIAYDETETLGRFARVQEIFTPEAMLTMGGRGQPSRRPIFILGMMRSGSTLVEQVLASHPRVFAAGERLDFQETLNEVIGVAGDALQLPEFAALLTPDAVSRLGSRYLQRLELAESAAHSDHSTNSSAGDVDSRIIDKLPANFLFVGLIHLVFPNAAIIHTCRDPIDTCLSCFGTLFASPQPQTYELGELGRYYRAYSTLMDHWRRVLPPRAMLEVQYESLVNDFGSEARRIVEYCGLDWQNGCLEFYKNQLPVRTASMAQVRQPIYRTSIGRPRPDATALRSLLIGLGLTETDRGSTG